MSSSGNEKPISGRRATETSEIKLSSMIRSDELVWIRDLFSRFPELDKLHRPLVQIRLVIDASRAQQELRWRLRSRQNPNARSSLQEACDCGIVVLFAPSFLDKEIEKYLEDIAVYANVSTERVREEWQEFRSHIHFHEPALERPDADCPDPKDLPYKAVCEELAASAVYTTDPHFRSMDVPVVMTDLDRVLRKHARAKSVEMVVNIGTGFTVTISVHALVEFVKGCRRGFERAPAWLKVGLLLVGAAVLIHPKSRQKLGNFMQSLWRRLSDPRVLAALSAVAGELVECWNDVRSSLVEIEKTLPNAKRRPAIACIREICLKAKTPLSPAEIAAQMRGVGYLSHSASLKGYVGRLMRTDAAFVRVSKGKWTLRSLNLPLSA
jgi:hypothetical protein